MEHFTPYLDIPQVKQLADQVPQLTKKSSVLKSNDALFLVGSNRKKAWRPNFK
jgi:hypothetical protein